MYQTNHSVLNLTKPQQVKLKNTNQVMVTAFCGSVFVDYCTAEDLLSLLRDLGLTLSLYCHLQWIDPQLTSPSLTN